MQIRHMVMTIKEAYACFGKEYTNLNVSKSKYFELRLKHVLLSSDMPHNVCVCEKRANFNFITEVLSKKLDGFPQTGGQLISKLVCNKENEICISGDCQKCSKNTVMSILPENCELKLKLPGISGKTMTMGDLLSKVSKNPLKVVQPFYKKS